MTLAVSDGVAALRTVGGLSSSPEAIAKKATLVVWGAGFDGTAASPFLMFGGPVSPNESQEDQPVARVRQGPIGFRAALSCPRPKNERADP